MLLTHLMVFFLGSGGAPPPAPATSDEPRGYTHKRSFRRKELELLDDIIEELRPKIRKAKTRAAVEAIIEDVTPVLENVRYEASPIAGELLEVFRQYAIHQATKVDILATLRKADAEEDEIIAMLLLH